MDELLELLRKSAHAAYISDLPRMYAKQSLSCLCALPLERFSLQEVSAAASYLMRRSVSFSTYEAARQCLRGSAAPGGRYV